MAAAKPPPFLSSLTHKMLIVIPNAAERSEKSRPLSVSLRVVNE
jgi:hypothetical protein